MGFPKGRAPLVGGSGGKAPRSNASKQQILYLRTKLKKINNQNINFPKTRLRKPKRKTAQPFAPKAARRAHLSVRGQLVGFQPH